MTVKGRFAPSPSGVMHAGNIFASLIAWLVARSQNGKMVLRIENLDSERSKQEFADKIQRDYEMLGLFWDEGPYFQHDREEAYRAAYEALSANELIYPCFCTRKELNVLSAPHAGENGKYHGACRNLNPTERLERAVELASQGRHPSYRIAVDDREAFFHDVFQGDCFEMLNSPEDDFVIRRADSAYAYQLAVVIDDAEQGINSVVRGADLLSSTPKQVFLQQSLGLPTPVYGHVPLLVDSHGNRLSKRNMSSTIDELLVELITPEAVLGHIAYTVGLIQEEEPVTPEDLLQVFDIERAGETFRGQLQIEFQPS